MLIIPDTSVLLPDYSLEGPRARTLIDGMEHFPDGAIALPAVVLDEMKASYRRRITELHEQLESSSDAWEHLAGQSVGREWIGEDVDKLVEDYERRVRLALAPAGGEILQYPDQDHEHVARRAMEYRRPFQKRGTGYRDYLIWLTVLRALEVLEVPVCFVTANRNDFGKGSLHPDLVADLDERGIDRARLRYFDSLDALLRDHVRPVLAQMTELKEGVSLGRVGEFGLSDWIAQELHQHADPAVVAEAVGAAAAGMPWVIRGVMEVVSIEAKGLSRLRSEDVLLWAVAELIAWIGPEEQDSSSEDRITELALEFEVVLSAPGFTPGEPYIHQVIVTDVERA